MPTPNFGGLSPAEAGRRSAAKRAETRRQATETVEEDAGLRNLRKLAATGTGTTAVQAQRYLDERVARDAQRINDQGLLALLSQAQRDCIEAHLRGEAVSEVQAIEAWAEESPGDRDDPQSASGLSDAWRLPESR
jgi:hypothetical protein